MSIMIRGVHAVDSPEPCHLIEAEIINAANFNWAAVTQKLDDQPPSNWQVPWDERAIDEDGRRWIFFFHYLQLKQPLLTPFGSVELPPPTPTPPHLEEIEYESPW